MTPDSVFLQAILRGDRRAATAVAEEALRAGASLCTVYQEIVTPALVQVGHLWQTNVIPVSSEHIATAVAHYVVAQIYASQPVPVLTGRQALVTGVAGDLHGLGATMVADVLEAEGWEVSFLGTDLPGSAILQEIEQRRPELIAFSVTLPSRLPEAAEVIRQVAPGLRILVGGRAFGSVSAEWCRELGVQRGSTLLDLLRLAG